jgi:hypothetical protein
MYFSWHYVIWYHNQSISPGNVWCGTTTNVFYLAMCYAVSQPMYFTWQWHWLWYRIANYQLKYTVCGTSWHIVRCKALVVVPHNTLPVEIHWLWYRMTHWQLTWQCAMRYHNQCFAPDNVPCGTTTSVFQLAICYAVQQPMYFTWQCQVKYTGCGTA